MVNNKQLIFKLFLTTISLVGAILLCWRYAPVALADGPLTFVGSWGSNGSANGRFNRPEGIFIDANDNIYVVDRGNNRIQKFNTNGQFLGAFGGSSVMNSPVGIAYRANTFYVTDGNSLILIKEDNTLINDITGVLNNPAGIAVDSSGNVYVVDTSNHKIRKFNPAGTPIGSGWGGNGTGNGEFNSPKGIAIYNNEIYVVDSGNNRVQKFSTSGSFISKWGSSGSGVRQFNNPTNIILDSNGFIYVVDTGNWRVQVFLNSTAYSTEWPLNGTAGQTNQMQGIAIDSKGLVYVTDAVSQRVQKFREPEISLSSDKYRVDEDAGQLVITATLNSTLSKPATVQYSTSTRQRK